MTTEAPSVNPYEPPSAAPANPESLIGTKPRAKHWLAFAIFLTVQSACFGSFVFFPLLEILGVFVNWPNVVPLLCVAFLLLALTWLVQRHFAHPRFATRFLAFVPLLLGTGIGVTAAGCARMGWI